MKSLQSLINDVVWAKTLKELTANTANNISVLVFCIRSFVNEQQLLGVKVIINFWLIKFALYKFKNRFLMYPNSNFQKM